MSLGNWQQFCIGLNVLNVLRNTSPTNHIPRASKSGTKPEISSITIVIREDFRFTELSAQIN